MSIQDQLHPETKQRMQKTIDALKKDFARIRTGRASPALLDGIMVDYYGSPTPLNQVTNISVPDARLLMIQPWDKSMIGAIEKAIMASELGLNPQNDGNVVRLPIPTLSEEQRKELVKQCKKIGEESKVAIRNIRRDSNEKAKKAEKNKEITQDEQKQLLDDMQNLTDEFISRIDKQLENKEEEIMTL